MAERDLLIFIINRIPGLTPGERLKLMEEFHSEDEFRKSAKVNIEMCIRRPLRRDWTMETVCALAEGDFKAALRRGIRWTSWNDGDYPPLLREIFDPPPLLYYRGKLPDPEKPLMAIVGTRHPSAGAQAQAFEIARELGRAGVAVVSGLALGIDAAGHRGNLEGSAPTVAVLGCGADMVYPQSNRPLARRILEGGGAIISEYPPGTEAFKWNFPARNRIISALARGVLVVEAPEHSGALITAGFALDQGRDLWTASAGIASGPSGAGTRKLAGEGARIIHNAAEILSEWKIEKDRKDGEEAGLPPGQALARSLAKQLNIEFDSEK
ncbi:MAG: DNA-processing protein DprA [Treponema sp.]|jgi:DNA processing protein|nr:DNA-processing protein DprA [Treponema sp.]